MEFTSPMQFKPCRHGCGSIRAWFAAWPATLHKGHRKEALIPSHSGPKLTAQEKRDQAELINLLEIGKFLDSPIPGSDPPIFLIARSMLRIRNRKGLDEPLAANPAQQAFERDRTTGNIILKARQMGITTWVAARFFLKTITTTGTLTVLVAQTREAAENIFQIVKRFWEALDEELREGPLQRNIANARAMRFPALDSEFRVLSASDPNAGRGLTMQNLHCSEVARWPGSASETLAGLRAALAPGGELVIESTPNGAYGCFYEEWAQGLDPPKSRVPQVSPLRRGTEPSQQSGKTGQQSNETTLTRHFFPWWLEPAYTAAPIADPSPEEQQLMLLHNLTPEQIGHRRRLENDFRRLRSQEYAEDAETCFRATGDCCFDADAIDARIAQLSPPNETRRGSALQIWLPPQPRKKYILGIDPAGGGESGDFAAVEVIDQETGLQCAELQEHLRTLELTRVSVELAKEYNNALIAVERNNHGSGVDAYLVALEKYPNVYETGGQRGWPTTAASKPGMVGLMGALLADSPQLFLSRRLLAECRTFVAFANGRTGAVNGAHDDCFMAMAVAHSVRREILNGGKTR